MATAAAKTETDGMARGAKWSVRDTNQGRDGSEKPRVHVIGGVKYGLWSDKDTKMPEAHARIFLKDPAFRVFNDAGDEIAPLTQAMKTKTGEAIPALQPGEVVANLTELTDDALKTRLAMFPGGDRKMRGTRDEMIDFILERQAAAQGAIERRAPQGDPNLEDADAEDVGRIVGDLDFGRG